MAFLLGMSGPVQGRKFEIVGKQTTLGRLTENKVVVDDPSVSSRHCEILREEDRFTVRDLESTNGTAVNNHPVTEQRLKPKDLIRIGGVELMFDGQDVEVAEPPAPPPEEEPAEPADVAPEPAVAISAEPSPPPSPSSFQFGARRDSRAVWVALISLLVVLAVIGLAFFALKLFIP